jgi:3-hydroxyacyl-CoA dehydrogenase
MPNATMNPFRRVGVLGAGVMGTGIACHFANAGLEVLLLDIPPPDGKGGRNAFAERALQAALKSEPKPLFHPSRIDLIKVGNLEDDLGRLKDADWVVEAVKEDLDVKRALFARLEAATGDRTIITSNTSGLPLAKMTEGRSAAFKKRFFITHFFNPPRYMKLLELIQGPQTDPELYAKVMAYAEEGLGKGVVAAKDTPNFIANRIGTYGMLRIFKEMTAQKASIEEIDAVFGESMGRPKSAVFRTADVVGLDTLSHVAQNCYDNLSSDPERDIYRPPEFLLEMVKAGRLGAKSGGGFYKKTKKTDANPEGLDAWDLGANAYRPLQKVRLESLGKARKLESVGDKIKTVVFAEDRAGQIAWPVMRDSLAYAAARIPEIADSVEAVDQAMRWGFGWDLGPFETWDALGFEAVAARMDKDGLKLPAWVQKMRAEKKTGFYAEGASAGRAKDARHMDLAMVRGRKGAVVAENTGAALHDVGDGIFAVEFHTKGNALDGDIVEMLHKGIEHAEAHGKGVVIYNDGQQFSFGANIMLIYMLAQSGDWKQLEQAGAMFQGLMQRIRYARVPVVAAPFGRTLGGGCEVCLAAGSAAGIRPHSELYMGLVEVGVGLLPGAGGTVNSLFGLLERVPESVEVDPLPFVAQVFKQIALAQVSLSVEEARAMGYVPPNAQVTFDRRLLLHDAKAMTLGLAEAGYRPPVPRAFRLPGESGMATLATSVRSMVQTGLASEHDAVIANKIARVLCGGPAGHTKKVTEQEMLDLEREAFLSLCGEAKSQERIAHMLNTNKPLRN